MTLTKEAAFFGMVLCLAATAFAQQPVATETHSPDSLFWLANALNDHGFTVQEAAVAADISAAQVEKLVTGGYVPATAVWAPDEKTKVLPYPGGRHPRIGFRDGAINPMRGTKASIFAPWDPKAFIVVDLPEAIFSDLGLIFLAHTHIPTIWDEQGIKLEDVQWTRLPDGGMLCERTLPNGLVCGALISPVDNGAAMELLLQNGGKEKLTGLRTQVCVMLKGMPGFTDQTLDNKTFEKPIAMAASTDGADHFVLTAWSRCGRVWGNERVPCIHSDPVFRDLAPGEIAVISGRVVMCGQKDLEANQKMLRKLYSP